MSSFRIDRQYVAFETAETQPVYATNKVQQTRPATEPEGNAFPGDVSKLYNEIYERLQREHAEQAEYMLSKAADEAQEIVERAKKQADEILRQATASAEKMRDELTRELEAEASARENKARTGLVELETKLQSDYTELVDGMRGKIIALVMEIVRKVIGIKLAQTDEVFMGMIRDALERLKQTGAILIRVCPEDYIRYFGRERDDMGLDGSDIKISAVEEPGFSPGDLIIESEGEMIDLSISRQINLIEEAFLN